MYHPQSRQDRRYVRDCYIRRRKFIQQKIWRYCSYLAEVPPHEGEGYAYRNYLEYLAWQELSEDDRKTIEVMAVLDRKYFEPPTLQTPIWGRYSKSNLTCACGNCSRDDREYVKQRRKGKKAIQEQLEDF